MKPTVDPLTGDFPVEPGSDYKVINHIHDLLTVCDRIRRELSYRDKLIQQAADLIINPPIKTEDFNREWFRLANNWMEDAKVRIRVKDVKTK